MKTKANPDDIKRIVESAKEKGWTVTDEKDRFTHIVQLSSPMTKLGDWVTITIANPTRHPKLRTTWHYHKGREADRGLWYAEYALTNFKP